jgi:uncharacterized protein YndB with AHSA1/START domain
MQQIKTAHAATRTDRNIVITRDFDAPPATVFEAWTQPEQVSAWWDPSGVPLATCEIDLRPSGSFRFVHGGAHGHVFAGTYREIAPPSRLVFTTRVPTTTHDSVGTLLFDEHADGTRLTMTIECASKEDRDALLAMRIDKGTAQTLENLGAYLRRHFR